jgi:CRP-like cAMP-binding protein
MQVANTQFMDDCSADEIATVAAVADEMTVEPGTTLRRHDGEAHQCYLVLEGKVDVVVDGRVATFAGPGELVGELSLLDLGTRSATLVARTWARVAAISGRDLDSLMALPGVRRGVIRQIIDRFRELDVAFYSD